MVTFFHKTYLNGYSTGVTRHGKVDSKRKNLEAGKITSVFIVKKREKGVYFYHKKRKESVVIHLHVEGVRTPKLLWNPI